MDISGKSRRGHRVIAVVTASALLALTGCGSDSGGGGDGDKGTISKVLNYKQALSLTMVRKFSRLLHIPAEALIAEYELRQ